jgi:hypothetical protein
MKNQNILNFILIFSLLSTVGFIPLLKIPKNAITLQYPADLQEFSVSTSEFEFMWVIDDDDESIMFTQSCKIVLYWSQNNNLWNYFVRIFSPSKVIPCDVDGLYGPQTFFYDLEKELKSGDWYWGVRFRETYFDWRESPIGHFCVGQCGSQSDNGGSPITGDIVLNPLPTKTLKSPTNTSKPSTSTLKPTNTLQYQYPLPSGMTCNPVPPLGIVSFSPPNCSIVSKDLKKFVVTFSNPMTGSYGSTSNFAASGTWSPDMKVFTFSDLFNVNEIYPAPLWIILNYQGMEGNGFTDIYGYKILPTTYVLFFGP